MRKQHILIISVAFLLLIAACGKKGPPVPMRVPLPGGIRDLTGEVKDGVLFLSFTIPSTDVAGKPVTDLAGFSVFKNCSTCVGGFAPWKEVRLDEKQGYTIVNGRFYIYDDDLMVGKQYSYRVHPMTKLGTLGAASNIYAINWQSVPDPPEGVSAKAEDGKVELMWTKKDDLLYNVYRVIGHAYSLTPVNPGPLSTPAFADSGLKNGETYRYEVRAVLVRPAGGRWEGRGMRVEATPKDTTPPAAPEDVKAERKAQGVLITWTMNKEPDLAGFNVYRTDSGKTGKLNKTPVKGAEFLDDRLPDLRYVSYYVTGVDTSGNESGKSKELIIILMKE